MIDSMYLLPPTSVIEVTLPARLSVWTSWKAFVHHFICTCICRMLYMPYCAPFGALCTTMGVVYIPVCPSVCLSLSTLRWLFKQMWPGRHKVVGVSILRHFHWKFYCYYLFGKYSIHCMNSCSPEIMMKNCIYESEFN